MVKQVTAVGMGASPCRRSLGVRMECGRQSYPPRRGGSLSVYATPTSRGPLGEGCLG